MSKQSGLTSSGVRPSQSPAKISSMLRYTRGDIDSHAPPFMYRRNLELKAKFESRSSYSYFQHVVPGAFDIGVIVSTLGWRIPFLRSRNPPESARTRPSTESVRIRNAFLCGQNAHTDCDIQQIFSLRGCSEFARICKNPTLDRIRLNPETPSQVQPAPPYLDDRVWNERGGLNRA